MTDVKARLEYLRGQIRAECISYGEIAELQGLADQIDPGDVELLEWAGVPEFPEDGATDNPLCPASQSPAGLALRAIQKYDEQAPASDPYRFLLIEAETHLGEALGLECTGAPDGTNEDGSVAYYSHDGGTCPIHEWLMESDGQGDD